jgi:phospholipid/cholesterol/gamma-HCH transport system substrate-binding protein
METRANHVLIGAFTLAVIVAAFSFILWLAKNEIDQHFAAYDILFEGSVTGLNVAGDVRYQGVRVGQVKEIRIYEKNPKLVRVRIEIDANTPVNAGSRASLEFFGITGVLFVQINSGDGNAPPLVAQEDQEVPIIASEKSSLEALFAGAPQLLENAAVLVERLSLLVNTDNRKSISGILKNAETVSASVAGRAKEIDELILNANKMSSDFTQVSGNLNALTARLDKLSIQAETTLNTDLRDFLKQAGNAARSAGGLANEMTGIVRDNKGAINNFGDRGLREFASFVVEARQLVTTLDRVAQRLESDPARFFLGNSASEYKAE